MKKVYLLILINLLAISVRAQTDPDRYEASKWKLWLLEKPEDIALPAPGTQSKAELKTIRERIATLTDEKLQAIKYWDAGAPAYRWNQITPALVDMKPEIMLRIPASWVNIAIYDATVLAWREKLKYKRQRPSELDRSIKPLVKNPSTYSYPCEHTVTAAAAATVLAYFIPEKADSILQLARLASQSRVDAGVQFQSDIEAGWALGEQVAQKIIEKAKQDGSGQKWTGTINTDPKKWTGKYPMGITLQLCKPFVLQSANQFRPAAPPDFKKDMDELRSFKQTFKSRTTAFFWANSGEFWTDLASKKMFEYHISDDAPAAARIYAALHTANHDMAIAIFDAKYTYWGIRPIQYDTAYRPLISTPPFPGYPSGHAAGGATASAVLERFFPADAKLFQQYAQDCADSRFYAGIHFRTDNETALVMGRALGKYIVDQWMRETSVASGKN